MSDWRTAPVWYVKDGRRILDDRGEPLAVVSVQGRRELLSFLLSRNRTPERSLTDAAGAPLLRYTTKVGDFTSWLKVVDSGGTPIGRIDRNGTIFTAFKDRFTVRDASGAEIGRIDNPVKAHEFVFLDHAGARIARGLRVEEDSWDVQRETAAIAGPWPEFTAAFFLSVRQFLVRMNS